MKLIRRLVAAVKAWYASVMKKSEKKNEMSICQLLKHTKLDPLDMRLKRIFVQDEEKLGVPCQQVTLITPEITGIVSDLVMVSREFSDITLGLSANQIGHDKAIFITCVKQDKEYRVFANAEIIGTRGGRKSCNEYCLSRLGKGSTTVKRHNQIYIKYMDLSTGLMAKEWIDNRKQAQVIQHEIDHMNGKVI